MTKFSDADRKEAVRELRKLVKAGGSVFTILRHVSSSGMSRVIDLIIVVPEYDNTYPLKPASAAKFEGERDYSAKPKRKLRGYRPRSIGYLAAKAMGDTFDRDRQGIKVGGCGMDMGFHLVYNLGRTMFPKGTKKGAHGDSSVRDGGYALDHKWL
jgi:hypothetical protein